MESVPDILSRIAASKREEISALVPRRAELERRAAARPSGRRDFTAALRGTGPAIIAEIKRASPSKGLLVEDFDPPAMARRYAEGGAAALSVLTDETFFRGSLSDLGAARGAVSIPVLRKDFTLDEIQLAEAAAHGADAILLIAALLTARRMRELRERAEEYGLAALVEVHSAEELRAAADSGARIVGVNNRNLRTFEVRLETSLELAPAIPDSAVRVSESGIRSAEDVRRLREAGYHAFLVGEHLMKSLRPAEALRALMA